MRNACYTIASKEKEKESKISVAIQKPCGIIKT
jgi:hypothetical protein